MLTYLGYVLSSSFDRSTVIFMLAQSTGLRESNIAKYMNKVGWPAWRITPVIYRYLLLSESCVS